MLVQERKNRLVMELPARGVSAIFLGPSTDLEYLAALPLFPDERFKGVGILADGRIFAIVPRLYDEEMGKALGDVPRYVWDDAEGFGTAWTRAIDDMGLSGASIAVNDGVRACDLLDAGGMRPAKFVNGADFLSPLRRSKEPGEIETIARASLIADRVEEGLASFLRPGMKEKEGIRKVAELFEKFGAQGMSFSPIVASGPNGAMPHYGGGSRELREGDFVVCDLGGRLDGYCSDTTRTFCIGEPTQKMRDVYEIVKASQIAGEAACGAGVPAREVDRASRKVIEDAGFGAYFLNRTGHGVGIAIHEAPYIKESNPEPLAVGDVFSVEPGIYIPGEFGVRIENLVTITEEGPRALNGYTRELQILR
jgi:Xaa-Pro aminopeptidase